MTEKKGAERRRGVRTEVLLKVEYDDPEMVATDYLTNLGSGGLFIRSETPFDVGHEFGLLISFPGFVEPLSLRGVVRWRQMEDNPITGEQAGMGVELDLSDPSVAEVLEALVQDVETTKARDPDRPLRLLLVEDNEFVQELFRHGVTRYCKEAGHEAIVVVTADDGREALELLEAETIDLAIVDQVLPILSGTEVIQRMRADPRFRELPVMAVSASGEEAKREALEAGADFFVDKPIQLATLLRTLDALVQRGKK